MNELPILLVDNRNPFCSRTMRILFKKGGYNKFNFVSIYSQESRTLLAKHGIMGSGEKLVVLCEKEKVFIKSAALLQAARKLNGIKSMIYWFVIIPHRIRDAVYDRLSGSLTENY